MRNGTNGSPTWKWIAGALMAVTTLLTGAWLTSNTGEIAGLKVAQKQTDSAQSDLKTKTGVIEEKVRRIEEDVKDVKESQKKQADRLEENNRKLDENNRKLDELLRRSR